MLFKQYLYYQICKNLSKKIKYVVIENKKMLFYSNIKMLFITIFFKV